MLRVDADDIRKTKAIPVGGRPRGITVGADAVWVAIAGTKSVMRINPRTYRRRIVRLGVAPTFVTVGGGSVWATAQEANRLFRIDPAHVSLIEQVDTGSGPFAVDVANGDRCG